MPRLKEHFVPDAEDADVLLCGLPYDGAVLGRRGAAHGPSGIRAALRWSGTDGLRDGPLAVRIHDVGDAVGLEGKPLVVHGRVRDALVPLFQQEKTLIVLGGDNSLSFPVVQALGDARGVTPGRLGLIVVDAHYDLRDWHDQPTSGTPFRRILTELPGTPVQAANLVEVGIRPYANAAALGAYAAEVGIHVIDRDEVRSKGAIHAAKEALKRAGDGVDHLWLSIDIDALDQSIAAGCSAPGADGLRLDEVLPLLDAVAADGRCRGMEIMETAPALDPTGNTQRSAAWLVTRFVAALGGA